MIAATNTPEPVLRQVAEIGRGYTYCLARSGVTGIGANVALDHANLFSMLGALDAAPPVLGFGISTPDQVEAGLAAGAQGVISGSAIVALVADHGVAAADPVCAFVASMKDATRRRAGDA